jgi:hypothetical protein
MPNENLPPRIHVLAKPTGATCNLNCSYCFFLNKEQLYLGSHFRMSDEVLEQYIRQLIESHRTDKVTVAWQGGEPTLMGLRYDNWKVVFMEQRMEGTLRIWQKPLVPYGFRSSLICARTPSSGPTSPRTLIGTGCSITSTCFCRRRNTWGNS